MNRRDFLKKLGIGAAAVVAAPLVSAQAEIKTFDEGVFCALHFHPGEVL